MKKLLYVGHAYHQKTKSVRFLLDLLENEYEVHYFAADPLQPAHLEELANIPVKEFDVLVVFQIMPSINEIRRFVTFKKGIFFPMYDFYYGSTPLSNPIWNEYKDFTIINFSKTLHNDLKEVGFETEYIQYFPKPFKDFSWGAVDSIYFWQRVTHINIYLLYNLIINYPLRHMHLHKAIDPAQQFIPVSEDPGDPCGVYFKSRELTYSSWYETREEMYKDMEKSALYMAPRYHEGIGLSFLEAMAMGRCVIGVDHPTMNEYIVDGQNGFLFRLEDQRPLDITPEKVQEIQKNAFEFVQKGYQRWEESKHLILEWIARPAVGAVNLCLPEKKAGGVPYRWGFWGGFINWIKGAGVTWQTTSCSLFGFIPLYKVKKMCGGDRVRFCVFGIPVYERKVNKRRFM